MSLLCEYTPHRGVTLDRMIHRGSLLISYRSFAWDDGGRWEGQGVCIGAYSSYEFADLQLEQTHERTAGECGSAINQGLLA